jgi:phosphoadenosine phosphosulfate reductase
MTLHVQPRAADRLPADFASRSLAGRLRAVRERFAGRLVFTTSFGLEDQAITHAIAESGAEIALVTLDTGRLFPETYDVWAETEARYGLRVAVHAPEPGELAALVLRDGINGFRNSVEARKACCGVRKLGPLKRALDGAEAWITGLRAEQSLFRTGTGFLGWDEAHHVQKVNPIADWSRSDLTDYVRANEIPYNALHDRGFPSIGCAPCTRAIRVGEDERAGRWWWENEGKKECGLHIGAPPPAEVPLRAAITGS